MLTLPYRVPPRYRRPVPGVAAAGSGVVRLR
ncbi:hypothetical protein BJ987_001025 [Nocardia goodfellowii]|uniref:Uncharacterized protein n=1 Tax=Nocardia goodfellowii TaxID=882446 RepID=A0ABS4QAL9_9NOCA|nr:hypothetical protein [Nocardia goodfellowii]